MFYGMNFENFKHFCIWFQALNPDDELDKHEAMTVYFNLEIYEGQI